MTTIIDQTIPWAERTDPAWLAIEPRPVPLASVGFAQPTVTVEGMVKHAAARLPGHDPADDYPRMVESAGRFWVVDGAHRTLVALVRGEQTILARVRLDASLAAGLQVLQAAVTR